MKVAEENHVSAERTVSEELQEVQNGKNRNRLLISADVIGFDDRDADFSQIRDRFGGVARL